MRQLLDVALCDLETGTLAPSMLVLGVTVDEVDEAMALWLPYMRERERTTGSLAQHAHWDWSRKARAISGSPNYVMTGVTTAGRMQALALWDEEFEAGRHPDHLGAPLVYMHFLATAPWNDREISVSPEYKGAGTVLVLAGVWRSFELGYLGRLGLHALPQAEPFYRDRCRMADLGVDVSGAHQGLRRFEFTSPLAREFAGGLGQTV